MTNTAAISQPPIAAGEAIADRSRNGGRRDAAGSEDGGFPTLLSKLAGNRDRADRDASPAEDMRSGDGNRHKLAGWLRGNPEVLGDEARAGDLETLTGEQAGAQQDSDIAALLAFAAGNDAGSLLQGLGGDGALAAIAARVANGTASDAEVALVQAALAVEGNGEASLPDEIMLASLAKAANGTGERPADDTEHETTAILTVLRRETHLAPVHAAAAADAGARLAAELAAGGNLVLRAGALPDAGTSTDAALLPSGDATELEADAQLVDPRVAVTAARGGHLAVDLRQGGSSIATLQAASDALASAGNGAAGIEQAPSIMRTDALVNAGAASGVAQQIADRVVAEAGTSTAQTGTAQAGRPEAPALAAKQPFGSPVKVLYIQLQPADLGIVTIRMSVKDQALQLDLEVGRGETAQLIQRDRETLSTLLRSAGYLIDGVDVRVADQAGAGAPTGNSQSNMQMPGGGQSGASQGDARSPGARPQDERRGNAFGNERNGDNEQAGTAPRRGDIYV